MINYPALKKYINQVLWIGGAALFIYIFGEYIFKPLEDELFSKEAREGVFVQAIPFVTRFIALLLVFILVIALLATRFNHKISYRLYYPVELTIIAGILCGVVSLFQPWEAFSYEYGFMLLLGSTLSFTLWSHLIPRPSKDNALLPPLKIRDHLIGLIVGGVVVAFLAFEMAQQAKPEAPYGYRQRIWERGLDEDERQAIAQEAEDTYESFEVPYLIFMGLFPGTVVYFIVRETVSTTLSARKPEPAGLSGAAFQEKQGAAS